MAMEMVAGAFLESLFLYMFEKMQSPEVIHFFRGRKLDIVLLNKLKIAMITVMGLLDHAEEKQVSIPAVKIWLDELKDAAYEADDFLDGIACEDLRSKSAAGSAKRKVLKSLFSRNPLAENMNEKLKEILGRIEYLQKQMKPLGLTLREGIGEKPLSPPTTSLQEDKYVDIRGSDKEAVIRTLQSDDSINGIGVICIAGQGGIGKTTIARQVYNETKVQDMFDHKAWVHVSQEFSILKITADIHSQVCRSSEKTESLEKLQAEIQNALLMKQKKILLVLDDAWTDKSEEWDNLLKPFSGAKGSRIIITARDPNVASAMTIPLLLRHTLPKLICDDCWSVLARFAFPDGDARKCQQFEEAGREIADRCGGLPLAAKLVGSLLRFKSDVAEWRRISKSNVWDLVGDSILPALKLSYHYLPSHLKQCVAYCAIFPKGFIFKKEFLIHFWIAEGFLIQSERKKSVVDMGMKCFDSLVSTSFIEEAKGDQDEACFVMHDLIHDLCKSVAGDFAFTLDEDDSTKVPIKARYLSAKSENIRGNSEWISEGQLLRSFLILEGSTDSDDFLGGSTYSGDFDKLVLDLVQKLKRLRVLHLETLGRIYTLPDSIGSLNHLRYLSLRSVRRLKRLPESICDLCYLQVLILRKCDELIELPKNLIRLSNLFHLDVRGCRSLRDMPHGMGQLTKLETLDGFILGRKGRSTIKELEKLPILKKLSIGFEGNFVNDRDATDAPISRLEHLDDLELDCYGLTRDSSEEINALEKLRPHTNLKSLRTYGYGGEGFPDWLTRSNPGPQSSIPNQSLSNLVHLTLRYWINCSCLPPLGQLESLEHLTVVRLPNVKTVSPEFYGSNLLEHPFPSLRILKFEGMKSWCKWEDRDGAFPNLEELYLDWCPSPTALPDQFHHLPKLVITNCHGLRPRLE